MASTRNKNSMYNYKIEQYENNDTIDYNLYKNSACGAAFTPLLAGNGLMSGKMHSSALSTNNIDIESMIFGINSSNLEAPKQIYDLNIINNNTLDMFDKSDVIMPTKLQIDMNNRPGFHNI
jgi:hypothetical protein